MEERRFKSLKVAIHQPNYLPYLGFFLKMRLADIFVILDNVPFSNDSVTHRVRTRNKNDWVWLTIPIEHVYHFKHIKDIHLPRNDNWRENHKQTITSNYSRCKYFDNKFMDEYYTTEFSGLCEFNEFGIRYLRDKLGMRADIVRASELDIDYKLKSTDLLIEITKAVGGDTYISGSGGSRYMEHEKFPANGIALDYYSFKPVAYPQRWNGFVPYLSAIDYVFNVGNL